MRISAGDTILRAWGFAGRRALPLLGAGWLSAAFYGAAIAYFLGHLSDAMLVSPRPDPGSFNNFALFYMFCIVLVTALANAAMSVPMLREAFGPGGEWKSVYLSIALREWSLFTNLLLLYVVLIAIVSAIAFAGSVGIAVSLPMIGHDGIWQGVPLAPVMEAVLVVIAAAMGLFLATRFGFFLATTAIVDSTAGLLQAWSLSSGNFWRILGLGLGLIVPVVLAAILTIGAICGAEFSDAMIALTGASHDNGPLFQMIHDHAGAIAAVWAIGLLVLNAIFAGASQIAYARAGRGEVHVSSREAAVIAEPAYAMTTPAALHLAPEEARRFEPKFPQADPPVKVVEPAPVVPAAVELREFAPNEKAEAKSAEAVPETPALAEAVKAEAAIASPDAEPPVETATADAPVTALPEEEPLAAHKDEIPAMDPLSHAAPAAPDPSGVPPATPLPSFVKAQPCQKSEPSAAA
jgi:hypothetical protein